MVDCADCIVAATVVGWFAGACGHTEMLADV